MVERGVLLRKARVFLLKALNFEHEILDKEKRSLVHFRRLARQAHRAKLLHPLREIRILHDRRPLIPGGPAVADFRSPGTVDMVHSARFVQRTSLHGH